MKALKNIPWSILILAALFLGIAPAFTGGEPHLLEKSNMLINGQLTAAKDIFDLFFHSSPLFLIALKALALSKKP